MENKKKEEEQVFVGIPTMALMPPKNYRFRVLGAKHKITIPKSGSFYDLDKEFFSKEDGDFVVVDESTGLVNISTITKVLFGVTKYPDLEYNQLFCPISLIVNTNTVDIIGQVVVMIDPEKQENN